MLAGPYRRPSGRLLAAFVLVALVALAGGSLSAPAFAQPGITGGDRFAPPQAFGTEDPRPAPPAKAAARVPSERAGLDLSILPEVRLPQLDTRTLLAEDEAKALAGGEKKIRVGVGRRVEMAALDGNWYELAGGGWLWAAEVVSPDAVALQLHLTGVKLRHGAELALYASGEVSQGGQGGHGTQGGKAAGQEGPEVASYGFKSAPAREIWTPTFAGERVRIEYFQPRGPRPAALPFRLESLQHLYTDPVQRAWQGFAKAAGPCHNDVTCFPAWATVARAVAHITFVSGGSTFLCTGQLLNAQNSDLTPYFLTANHCISTNAVAQTTQFFWLYQTAVCGGAPPALGSVPQSSTATLLSTGAGSDYTLMMAEGSLPGGLAWVGWTSAAVADGTASACVHHPSGDYKRISFGDKASNPTCGGANHLRINWTDGPTEGGSSGSGIYRNDTQQLYGQLHCGPSACGSETNDSYGAFSATFPSISTLLAAGTDDPSEDNDTCATARTVTTGTLASRIVKSTDSDWYKISVPAGKTLTVTLSFTHANGDIDTKLYSTCGGAALTSSTGTGNTETLTRTNSSGSAVTYMWQVYLFSDTRNGYSIDVSI